MKNKISVEQLSTAPHLVGKKVYLRPMAAEENETSYRWFMATDPQSQTCHEIHLTTPENYAARAKERAPNKTSGNFVIVRHEDNQLVGKIRFFHLNMLNRSAELGYLVGPEFHKQGYGKEGLRLLLGHLFNELNLNKVYAQTGSFNKASVKLLESLNFKLDGTLRQHHYYKGDLYDDLVYSLLKFEFNP